MQDAKEEVRSRLNIEDVVGEYVQLKRSGRNFKGLSPFTSEKTPSFIVSPEKQIWHDFSSNKGGDIFGFVMEVEGVDFRTSLEQLARKAGVDMSVFESAGSNDIAKRKKRLISANELAANYYQQSLIKNTHAQEYVFKRRRLGKDVVTSFRIGYAPDSGDALVRFLTKKGYTSKDISEAGLTNRFGGDLFRGRIMVPLMDGSGQVVGFTGRALKDEPNSPKYLNTPQTLIYDKSRHVFGLSQAKPGIRNAGHAVIVEGNLDVVSSHGAGISQVVATAGTAMTVQHLKSLVRLTSDVRLAFDGDSAGLSATERSIDIAQSVGLELTIIQMPDGFKDPDELVQKDKTLWQKAIDSASPAVDWVIEQYTKREDMSSAAGKRKFSTAAAAIISRLQDSVEREHYVKKVAKISDSSTEAIELKIDEIENKTTKRFKKAVQDGSPSKRDEKVIYIDNLVALSLMDPKVRELLVAVKPEMVGRGESKEVLEYVQKHKSKKLEDTPKELHEHDTYVKILLLRAEARYSDWDDKDRYQEARHLVELIRIDHKKQQKNQLTRELQEAESNGDDEKIAKLMKQINQLIKEIKGD
jgi:DNA primase